MTIGKKLALVFGFAIALIGCLAGLSIWSLRTVRASVDESQYESENMALSNKSSADTARVLSLVGNSAIRGRNTGEEEAALAKLRESYRSALDQLHARVVDPEGRRLMDAWEQKSLVTKSTNLGVTTLLKSGKQVDAQKAYLQGSVPAYEAREAIIQQFLSWQKERVAGVVAQRTALISRVTAINVFVTLLALTVCTIVGVLFARSIGRPLRTAVEHTNRVAEGDLSRDLDREMLERGDEIGTLSKSMQKMSASLRDLLKEMANGIQALSSSSTELSAESAQMSNGSRDASSNAHSVAAAAEQMTANVASVAAGMEQTTTNLASVSSHTEQMTATINEIAANSERARRITEEATRESARISDQMNQLGEAAREIGKVTETITQISSQTNLLALNATIEAARAGSAGKGFAVVANEIKELAQQTSKATEDIKARIEGVQSSTAGGIAEIEKVSKVIHDISEIVNSIAAAIEEQAVATKLIASNITEASAGVRDANVRIAETSQVTVDIARQIVSVDHAAGRIASGSEQVRVSAVDLARIAEQLQTAMAHFRVSAV